MEVYTLLVLGVSLNVLVVVSAPRMSDIDKLCISSLNALQGVFDVAFALNREGETPDRRNEARALNRVTRPLLDEYGYFFIVQSDHLLRPNALSLLMQSSPMKVIVPLFPYRMSALLEWDRQEGSNANIRKRGHSAITYLNDKIDFEMMTLIARGEPFLTDKHFGGWSTCLIKSDVIKEIPFCEDRSYDVTWVDEVIKKYAVVIDPRVSIGHIDRDGTVYYYGGKHG